MKYIPFTILALLASVPSVCAQEAAAGSAPGASPVTPHILGDLPDGTPAIGIPMPRFVIPPGDILETRTHRQGGRKITIQRIAPIAFPPPPPDAPLADSADPAVQAKVAAFQEDQPDFEFLFIGATVFRPHDSSPRTLVNLCQGTGESVTFWSSADLALLSGFSSFAGSDGKVRSLIMAWDSREIDSIGELSEKQASDPDTPRLPALPAGQAAFAIVSGKPAAETLADIQSLHDLYNHEHDRLQTAFEGRERARLAAEAERIAHPPKPKDIILNYWRVGDAAPAAAARTEGGAQ